MIATPPAPRPSSPLLGLLTPFVITIGIAVLLFLPSLIMHAVPGPMSGSPVPVQGHDAISGSAAAGIAAPIVR